MMYIADNGTAYADSHFHLEDGHIVNNFTDKRLGIHVRSEQSNNYNFDRHKRPLITRFVRWFKVQNALEYERTMPSNIRSGSLAETMKGLE